MEIHQEQSFYTAVNTMALVHDRFLLAIQIVGYLALVVGIIVLCVRNKRKLHRPWKDVARRSVPWAIAAIAMVGIPICLPLYFPGLAFLAANALAPVLTDMSGLFSAAAPSEPVFAGSLLDLIVFGAFIAAPCVLTVTPPKIREAEEEEEEDREDGRADEDEQES